jgi:hypothetical protein
MAMRFYAVFLFLATWPAVLQAEMVVLTGVYQGKDLYVRNPVNKDGVGFCIFEVLVNGQITSDEVNSPAFAVDLKAWKLNLGDPLEIVLRCKEDCEVKIINPEVIYPNSTYEMISVDLSPEGILKWTSIKETAKIPYNIEQFKWNKWVKVGEVQGAGNPEESSYTFQATLTSGMNLLRIQQLDHKGAHFSQDVRVTSSKPDVQLAALKVNKTIEFTDETDYEVFSEFGELVSKGRGKVIDCSKYFKGNYYINFDNKTGVQIEKK